MAYELIFCFNCNSNKSKYGSTFENNEYLCLDCQIGIHEELIWDCEKHGDFAEAEKFHNNKLKLIEKRDKMSLPFLNISVTANSDGDKEAYKLYCQTNDNEPIYIKVQVFDNMIKQQFDYFKKIHLKEMIEVMQIRSGYNDESSQLKEQ
jgi:hypothetical protein